MFSSDWWFGDNSLWGQASDKVKEVVDADSDWWFGDNSLFGGAIGHIDDAFTGGSDWWFGDNSVWGMQQDAMANIFGLGNAIDSQAVNQIQEQGFGGMSNIDALMAMWDAQEEEEGYMPPQKQQNNIFSQ